MTLDYNQVWKDIGHLISGFVGAGSLMIIFGNENVGLLALSMIFGLSYAMNVRKDEPWIKDESDSQSNEKVKQ